MIKTLVTAALALFVSASAFAETGAVTVKDFDIYVDQPTGFVFVKLPAGWKFVSRIEQAELARLPGTVLTALLAPEEADTLVAAHAQPKAQP